jgi:hypothetical protein
MKRLIVSLFLALSVPALASELDGSPSGAPRGVIVREDGQGRREVFRADLAAPTTDDEAATAAAVATRPENLIANVRPSSELDRASSTEAWYSWYNPYYYGGFTYQYAYSYWYSNTNFFYRPCYNWFGYGYHYSYYWY